MSFNAPSQNILNEPSILLSNDENQLIYTILGARKVTRATAVAQMYHAHPNPNKWEKFSTGAVCFVKDNSQRSYFIRLIDLRRRAVIFEQELYDEFHYSEDRPYFHSFPGHEFMVGLNFASEEEAEKFHAAVESYITYARRATMKRKPPSEPKKPVNTVAPGPVANKDPYSLGVDGSGKLSKPKGVMTLTKSDIGRPTEFRSLVGWDPRTGAFTSSNISPKWKNLLDSVGVTEEQLKDKDTADFIYDFVEKHGGIEKATHQLEALKTAKALNPPSHRSHTLPSPPLAVGASSCPPPPSVDNFPLSVGNQSIPPPPVGSQSGPFLPLPSASSQSGFQNQIVSESINLLCQFLPLLKDSQVLQDIEQEYNVEFNVKLPNGSTKSIVAFSSTIASMMYDFYPMTIESVSDYLLSSGPGSVSWNFFDDQQFKPMSPADSVAIEKLYQLFLQRLPYSFLKIGEWEYSYHFESMVQINTKTQTKRKIKRIPALKSLCLSCHGLQASVQASVASLHQKLQGMIIERKFEGCSLTISEPIIEFARSFCVKVDSSLDSIMVFGDSDYLDKVFPVLKQKQIGLESTPLLSLFPPEWEPQTGNIELKFVPLSSSEGAKVVSAFKKTMNANVSKIERIQNKFLYTKYDLCKKRMHEKNNGRVNEKWLFHGSRSVSPETIYKSEHGFDFRHAGQNCLWGRGAYFAVNAKYSGDSYAFRSSQGQQIFLAFVLTGDSIAMESDNSLVTPPRKEDGSGDYDSVNGVTGSSQIYVVYDHDKSYPAYLITFN